MPKVVYNLIACSGRRAQWNRAPEIAAPQPQVKDTKVGLARVTGLGSACTIHTLQR